ncbi:MAG: DUF488 domain-containing protein, partial [Alicyclobacillus sp.]|nr:DUF488 domain-containing protein [Alicyclobacillus sp.]
YEELGENAVLLCYEKHNDWCHRRMVADWFEKELGVVVPELGFDRSETLPYEKCGCGSHASTEPESKGDEKSEPRSVQMQLPLLGLM